MVLIVPEQSQRPYRFGMTLLCVGALFNWLGLADNYSEPVPAIRYIGVGLIAVGASLICMAMCFWMRTIHDPIAGSTSNDATNVDVSAAADPIHVISVDIPPEKPPDYAAVVDIPPCYEDAIKLNPSSLFMYNNNLLLPPPIKSNIVLSSDSTSCTLETGGRQPKAEAGRGGGDDDQQSLSQQQQQQNSSHEDNNNYSSFTKVLRKSIREIRKQLRSSSDSNSSASHQAPFTATTATTTSTSNASHDHDRNDAEQRSTSDNTCKNSNKEDVR